MSGSIDIRMTSKQAERYKMLLLRLMRYEIDEPWTDTHRKRLGLTVQQERDAWTLYWKLSAVGVG